MKRASNSYRLQMIKEVVIRREREACTDLWQGTFTS